MVKRVILRSKFKVSMHLSHSFIYRVCNIDVRSVSDLLYCYSRAIGQRALCNKSDADQYILLTSVHNTENARKVQIRFLFPIIAV